MGYNCIRFTPSGAVREYGRVTQGVTGAMPFYPHSGVAQPNGKTDILLIWMYALEISIPPDTVLSLAPGRDSLFKGYKKQI